MSTEHQNSDRPPESNAVKDTLGTAVEGAESSKMKSGKSSRDRTHKNTHASTHAAAKEPGTKCPTSQPSVLQQLQLNGEQNFIGHEIPIPLHDDSDDIEVVEGPAFVDTQRQAALKMQMRNTLSQWTDSFNQVEIAGALDIALVVNSHQDVYITLVLVALRILSEAIQGDTKPSIHLGDFYS